MEMESTCPICVEPYPETWEPSLWLQCSKCFRSVHTSCVEEKGYLKFKVDPVFFMCFDCLPKAASKEEVRPFVHAAAEGEHVSQKKTMSVTSRMILYRTGPRSLRPGKEQDDDTRQEVDEHQAK
ncbi:hypothetical protein MPTK1_3g21590 [Marchantia polymorpha subsp. ruderalis]|uniref:Zinc finger PHD-type domain-containing protein n=2 Tax=Marchantia polymorpha TaxID=3197 RepID=A0AAF6B3A4_MARPO|nr:hypothetical protein MARPO_0089s0057 [Marchantia polymorpha]BBN06488.1 hypothetical protein Mp_3g21590 [Marchantia polymorpha subsp. ruderalis]|eukprot:PTQ33431.1 hypothetical protein MARPO_0089s0057 [Marchantia polymorpha]